LGKLNQLFLCGLQEI